MPQHNINDHVHGDELHEQMPEFDPQFDGGYRSPVLMRIMLVIINLAALFFCRSLIQSWFSIHGTTPIWIPLLFLFVPLGSLFFIYYYMGRIGSEIILKLICFACCALQAINFFSPIDSMQVSLGKNGFSSDYGYVTEAEKITGVTFPSEGSATTVDSTGIKNENRKLIAFVKSLFRGEKLYSCTDVIYKPDQSKDFENNLNKSPIWLKEIPDSKDALRYSLIDVSGYNYFLFYDCDSKTYNTLPESGKHTFYQVMYNSQNHELRILKYTKTY